MSADGVTPGSAFVMRVDDVFRLASQDLIVTGAATSGEIARPTPVVVMRADRTVATALASREVPRGAAAGALAVRLSSLEGEPPQAGDRIESRAG